MKKRRIIRKMVRVLIYAGIIMLAFIIFYSVMRVKTKVKTTEFGGPTLPVMSVVMGDVQINRMYGHVNEEVESTNRESLTLLSVDREVNLSVKAYENTVNSISYEVTSLIDGSFVENGNASDLTAADGTYTAKIALSTPILMNQEYALKLDAAITTKSGESETIHYYTRIIQETGSNMDAYLQFANNFYRSCLDKNTEADLAAHMETDSSSNKSDNFDDVTINSSIDQVTWGNLAPELYKEAVPQVKEINGQTCSIVMNYILTAKDSDGNDEYYNVHDFYRLRTNQGEVLLVDLNRDTEQVFQPSEAVYEDEDINLGVGSVDVNYVISENQEYCAFVSGGDLWVIGSNEKVGAIRVFSFRGEDLPDERTERNASQIRICSVTDDGVVSFVVTGYMNSGPHEGSTGISAYTYTASTNLLEEELFINTDQNWEMLNKNLGLLTYFNDDHILYTYTGTQLLRTELSSGKSEVIKDAVNPQCIAASPDQRYVAWMDEMSPTQSSTIVSLNTDTGEMTTITAPEGEKLRLIGFFNRDLVYGCARDEDIVTDAAGNTTFGMYVIHIVDPNGKEAKTYQKTDTYVTGTSWSSNNLALTLGKKQDGVFADAGEDHIIDNEQDSASSVITTKSDSRRGQQVLLGFKASKKIGSKERTSELRDKTDRLNVRLTVPESSGERYYIYAGGTLADIETDTNAALQSADESGGVVLDGEQRYVYERGNWMNDITLDVNTLPQALLDPKLDAAAIQEAVGDDCTVLNYSGCSTTSIRYQISRGYPVVAKFSETKNVLIVGHDIFDNLWYYDPETKKVTAIGKNDSAAQFGSQGDIFLSYYKKNG
ncbi:MAG: hypothetical protein LKG40_04870 [Lachnospiraceae bacterium]|nr:hypothetical protein [Lachnospiraceae bacterium]MCI1328750.1 hypothetical protein [Lachnospiraceae bacterium]